MGAPSCWACLQGAGYINILTFEIASLNREFRRHSASIHGALVYFTLIFESENDSGQGQRWFGSVQLL